MKKQQSLLPLAISLLCMFSPTTIHTAAELPAINPFATVALWQAAKANDISAAQYALAAGANINAGAEYGDARPYPELIPQTTPLTIAVSHGNLAMVRFLLEHNAMADATIDSYFTPLATACLNSRAPAATTEAIVTELLSHNANANAQHEKTKTTPLMYAINLLQNENVARKLIFASADIYHVDTYGESVFDMIKTDAMEKVILDAWAISSHAFQQLCDLEKEMRSQMLQNPHASLADLIDTFSQAIPYYVNNDELQPDYDLLNTRIAEQWKLINQKLKIEKLFNLLEHLPIEGIVTTVLDYLFFREQVS